MGLFKRQGKTGTTWCIQYFANGKRIRESIGPSKKEAQLVLGKRQADIREGKFFDVRKESTLSFSVLCDRYLKEYAALYKKPRSYERNVSSTKVLKSYFGEKQASKITPEDVQGFIQHRVQEGKSGNTVNGEVGHLSHLFTWACQLRLTTQNPCRGAGKLKGNKKDRYLEREEIDRVLAVCHGDLRDMVLVSLGTGMRASEVLSLTREQVDLRHAVVVLSDSKNGDRRVIPLPEEVVSMLQRRPTPLGKWFAGGLGNLEKGFLRATKRAHLPGVTFHCLRHTYASYGVMSGVDLYTMSRLLGHRSVKMTERYAHLAPAHLQQAAIQTAKAIFAADVPHQVPQAHRVTAQIIEFPGEKAAVA